MNESIEHGGAMRGRERKKKQRKLDELVNATPQSGEATDAAMNEAEMASLAEAIDKELQKKDPSGIGVARYLFGDGLSIEELERALSDLAQRHPLWRGIAIRWWAKELSARVMREARRTPVPKTSQDSGASVGASMVKDLSVPRLIQARERIREKQKQASLRSCVARHRLNLVRRRVAVWWHTFTLFDHKTLLPDATIIQLQEQVEHNMRNVRGNSVSAAWVQEVVELCLKRAKGDAKMVVRDLVTEGEVTTIRAKHDSEWHRRITRRAP